MIRAEPRSGQLYRHFKGTVYRIITVGHHYETGEKMVVYYDVDEKVSDVGDPCIRPLAMFMSEVDRSKYPNVKQKFRFEEIKKC